jgi:hypothetical protein
MEAIPLSHDMIILRAYEARFGERRFDTWKLMHHNTALMQMALERDSPVTEADLRQLWMELGHDPDNFDIPPDALT